MREEGYGRGVSWVEGVAEGAMCHTGDLEGVCLGWRGPCHTGDLEGVCLGWREWQKGPCHTGDLEV